MHSTVVAGPAEQLMFELAAPAPRPRPRGQSVERAWARAEALAHAASLDARESGDQALAARLHREWLQVVARAPVACARRRRTWR